MALVSTASITLFKVFLNAQLQYTKQFSLPLPISSFPEVVNLKFIKRSDNDPFDAKPTIESGTLYALIHRFPRNARLKNYRPVG